MSALSKLTNAWRDRRSLLSIGLEPCPEYLPATGEFDAGIGGYERFLMAVVEGAAEVAAAFKFNLAFFEALGPEGWALLKRMRDRLPAHALVIADAKRGDIGSTAKRYAQATFEWLNADAVTLSPLMGRDSADPFLAFSGRLCYFLCLTSNPGSRDFLDRNHLSIDIARAVASWGDGNNCGLVVGATHPGKVAEIRAAAPGLPFLIPGIGVQGGEVESVAVAGRIAGSEVPGTLFHATRGVLADAADRGTFRMIVHDKAEALRARIASAASLSTVAPTHA